MKDIYKKIIAVIIIPFFLLLVWIVLSLFFTSSYSLSVLVSSYNTNNFISLKHGELLAKQKVTANIKAKENNLGIISVRFTNFDRISRDEVIFRIKEEGKEGWYYQNTYKVNQFQNNKFFTFGFPIISDSAGKQYYFEIQSLHGKRGDAIGVSEIQPVFIAQYQFTKEKLLGDKKQLIEFIPKKIIYSFSDINYAISSFIYFLPFIFYLLWYFYFQEYTSAFKKKYTVKVKLNQTLIIIYMLSVVLTIGIMQEKNNFVYLVLIGLWLFLIKVYKFESSVSYLFAILFLFACPFLVYLNYNYIAEAAANWAYFLLVIGTIQAFWEFKKKPAEGINYQMLLKSIIRKK